MSKLDELKGKIAGLRAQLAEKTDKIGFIRSWKEKRAKTVAAGPKGTDPLALSSIYRDGSTGTRLQVIAFYVFVAVALVSAGSLVKKIAMKMRTSAASEQIKKEISSGLENIKEKKIEEAEMLALGQFTANIYTGQQSGEKIMSIELWVRVSDPATAAVINNRNEIFREKTMDVLTDLDVHKVSLLLEEGKKQARARIRDSLNSALPTGKVVEVYIQNLIVQ